MSDAVNEWLDAAQARCDAATGGPWSTRLPKECVINAPASQCLCSRGDEHYTLLSEFDGGHSHLYKYWTEVYAGDEEIIEQGMDYDGGVVKEADTHFITHARTDLPKALDALRAVLAQHHPHDCSPEHGSWCSPCWSEGLCEGCSEDWPCPTVKGVAEALGVQQ